jgi:hypothetical protein
MRELFVSVDVETNGRIPGPSSMWSLGAAAILDDGTIVGEFDANLEELVGSAGEADTLAWWARQDPKILEACRSNPQAPELVMRDFVVWVNRTAGLHKAKPVCVAYPAGFDWTFVYWYIVRFGQESPFSFSCLDIKSYVAGKLGVPYREATKKNMPKRWFDNLPPHTHRASDDAKEQGLLFINILNDNARS